MAYLIPLLFCVFLAGCASSPPEVKEYIKKNNLAGTWVNGRNAENPFIPSTENNYVKFGCDGTIRYEYESKALPQMNNSDEGKIQSIDGNRLTFKSWIGLERTHALSLPTNSNAKLNFKSDSYTRQTEYNCN